MRRLTRSSAIVPSIEPRDDAPDPVERDDAQEITDILNQEAANAPAQSRKRKSLPSDNTSSAAAKRVKLEAARNQAASAPTSPAKRRSTRLSTVHKRLDIQPPPTNRNVYEFPNEEAHEQPLPAATQPDKGRRQLKKPAKNTKSPFKGLGEITTESNALVNLEASPRKQVRPRNEKPNLWKKIGKSVAGRPPRKLEKSVDPTKPDEAGDLLQLAQDDSMTPSSPELGASHVVGASRDTKRPPRSNAESSSARAPKLTGRDRGRARSGRFTKGKVAAVPPASSGSPQHTQADTPPAPSRNVNPLSEAARQTTSAYETTHNREANPLSTQLQARIDEADPETQEEAEVSQDDTREHEPARHDGSGDDLPEDVDQRADVSEDNEVDHADDDIKRAPQLTQVRRPPTDAENRAANAEAAEEEAKRQQMIAKQLDGIKDAVQIYNCEDAWTEALLAGAEIKRDRASLQPKSHAGGGCARKFWKMTQVYKRMLDEEDPGRALNSAERGRLNELVARCKHLARLAQPCDDEQERRRAGKDVYEHLIPHSLKLARYALQARSHHGTLDGNALKELYKILKITYDLAETARNWRPRPNLDSGIKGKTASDIKPCVKTILKCYDSILREDERAQYVDELAVVVAGDTANIAAQFEERKRAISARYKTRLSQPQPHEKSPARQPQFPAEVEDIDDLVPDDGRPPIHDDRHSVSPAHSPVRSTRPGVQRQPTEEIPAPSQPPLTEKEVESLLLALGKFNLNLETRWQDILNHYGRPGGRFEHYDMDQLISAAKSLRQTMEYALKNERKFMGSDWDFLRSVPL